jgi:hypothetical protein
MCLDWYIYYLSLSPSTPVVYFHGYGEEQELKPADDAFELRDLTRYHYFCSTIHFLCMYDLIIS